MIQSINAVSSTNKTKWRQNKNIPDLSSTNKTNKRCYTT